MCARYVEQDRISGSPYSSQCLWRNVTQEILCVIGLIWDFSEIGVDKRFKQIKNAHVKLQLFHVIHVVEMTIAISVYQESREYVWNGVSWQKLVCFWMKWVSKVIRTVENRVKSNARLHPFRTLGWMPGDRSIQSFLRHDCNLITSWLIEEQVFKCKSVTVVKVDDSR